MNQYAPQPQVVVKQSSGCKTALIVLGILFLLAVLAVGLLVGGCFAVVINATDSIEERQKEEVAIASNLVMTGLKFDVIGTDSLQGSFKIQNNNKHAVEDIVIQITRYNRDGNEIDSIQHTLRDSIGTGNTKEFKLVPLGRSHPDAVRREASMIRAAKFK